MVVNKERILYVLLVAISLLAPVVSYAGVSLIYPDSTLTSDVNTSPPLTWAQGLDYSAAQSNGFAGSLAAIDNNAGVNLTVSGLSGGTVTIDSLLNLTAGSAVTTYKLKISSALAGTLSPAPTSLKIRLWTDGTAPTNDGDAQVQAVLDLTAVVDTETATTIAGNTTVFVQLICEYASSTSGSSSVAVQPSSIVL